MISVRSEKLSFTYSDRVPLFQDVDLHLDPGWTGLVGSNGVGKTTLLRLLTGELEPQAGQVLIQPRSARIEHCRQDVERLENAVEAFADDWSGGAQRLRGLLRLEPWDLQRWPTLSPGERRRWQIGAALASEPEILLLDEPTNHLDAEGRDLLLTALLEFRGLGIVVSHDRTFLNELTRATLRLDGGPHLWQGAYDQARKCWLAVAAAERQAYEQASKEAKKARRRLAQKRREQRQADSHLSSRQRMKGPRDHDATSAAAKDRVRSAEARLGRDVGILRRQLEKSEESRRSLRLQKEKGRSLFVDFEPSPRQRLLSLEAPEIRAAEHSVLLRDVYLAVDRSSRIEIAGPNGSGKSTLLRHLAGGSTLPAERILYLPQELTVGESKALLRTVDDLAADEKGHVMEIVAALGVDPDRILSSACPSPGEARKLMLAMGLGRRVWALLLDEPTNHLDLPAIERLEQALGKYPGALVLVTHDPNLAASCTDTTWRLEGGQVLLA